jgi:hypothetical protein
MVRLLQRNFSTASCRVSWKSIRGSINLEYNVGESPARMGASMQPAFEISFALWGMIACAAIEVAQIF